MICVIKQSSPISQFNHIFSLFQGFFELATARSRARGVVDFGESNYAGRVFDAVRRVDCETRTSALAGGVAADFTHWSLCSAAAAVAVSSDTANRAASDATATSATATSASAAAADQPLDAVTWVGILPPAGVRACQTSFRAALDSVAALASVVSEMSALEQQWLELTR